MNKNIATNAADGDQASTSSPQGQVPTSTDQASNETSNVSTDDLLRQIADLRKENALHRRKSKEQEDAARAAEEQRLKEQGEFKQLAEQYKSRADQLEPIATSYETLKTLVSSQVEAQIKDWPAEVKALDPGKDAPIEQRLAWIEKARPIVEKMTAQQRPTPGNGPGPKPSTPTPEAKMAQEVDKLRAAGKYPRF